MNAFAVFGIVVSALINLAVLIYLGVIAGQILALRRGHLEKDDGRLLPLALFLYERYFEAVPPSEES
ncbi:MAG: hypothetical protein K0U16_07380 [Gammaproteobacteria bacterium]|nr:hypothetical protein [Gammaproteobacteria bacterium]